MKWTILLISSLLLSCSSFKYNIKKNDRYTDKMICKLSKEHNNLFYIRSTYSTYSDIWFYQKETIVRYRLEKGILKSIIEKQSIELPKIESIIDQDFLEFDNCLVLDGDVFGFKMDKDGKYYNTSFSVSIDCIIKGDYKSEFLKKIVNDIKLIY